MKLWGRLARRLVFGLATLLFVSTLVFIGTEMLPGDVAQVVLGQDATPETLAAFRKEIGLDQPAPVRYVNWLKGVAHGDLGKSFASGRPVITLIDSRLPATLYLGGVTALIAIPLAIGLGLLAAAQAGARLDRWIVNFGLITASGPEFMFAALFILLFSVTLRWLPATSYVSQHSSLAQQARALALPVLTLTFAVFAPTSRMTRSAVLNVLGSPFIEMALLKGVPRSRILLRHALPNAIAPIANVVGISLGYLVSGVVVVEVVFSYPGMAKMMVDSVAVRDLPLVQGCALVFGAIYVVLNLLTDLIAVACNPRLRAAA